MIINAGISVTDFNLGGINYNDHHRYRSRLQVFELDWRSFHYPDPPTLVFCLKEARETPKKNKGSSLGGTHKILGN